MPDETAGLGFVGPCSLGVDLATIDGFSPHNFLTMLAVSSARSSWRAYVNRPVRRA
jgi:hypothetical protein